MTSQELEMTKEELVKRINEVLSEIPVFDWAKKVAGQYLCDVRVKFGKEITVDYTIEPGRTVWNLPAPKESIDDAISRMGDLPIFEKYFLFIYTLYENYLTSNNNSDKDKKSLDLLRYRVIRNILVHNSKVVDQDSIDEFEKKAKQYDPSLTQDSLNTLFNYRVGAKISLGEFSPDLLKKFGDILVNTL